MSNKVKCFNVVKMVTDEATSQFGPGWTECEDRVDILRQYCEYIDKVAEEANAEAFEVEVDDIEMTIDVKMECPDLVIENASHAFYDLAERALKLSFAVSKETGNLVVGFTFPSIWSRVG
ncbi:MAG: hypothetical protein IJM20_02315 [Clostridia bacterium]|nr:hypothetical protein [Clostridia bacterium]